MRKTFLTLYVGLLLISLLASSLTVFTSAISSYPPQVQPLTDPSKVVRYNIDEIDALNPKSPDYGKIPLPERFPSNAQAQQSATQQLPSPQPGAHECFGTEIHVGNNLVGVFAKQKVVTNLELGSGEDRTLYAPTVTAPAPCPVESVTMYWRFSNWTSTARAWGIYDFQSGSFVKMIFFGDSSWTRDYIRYYSGDGDWCYYTTIYFAAPNWSVYLYNFTANNWQEMYRTQHSVPSRNPGFGWDLWESITYWYKWPNPFSQIQSLYLQVSTGSWQWQYCTATFGHEYNNMPSGWPYPHGWWGGNQQFYHWYVGS